MTHLRRMLVLGFAVVCATVAAIPSFATTVSPQALALRASDLGDGVRSMGANAFPPRGIDYHFNFLGCSRPIPGQSAVSVFRDANLTYWGSMVFVAPTVAAAKAAYTCLLGSPYSIGYSTNDHLTFSESIGDQRALYAKNSDTLVFRRNRALIVLANDLPRDTYFDLIPVARLLDARSLSRLGR